MQALVLLAPEAAVRSRVAALLPSASFSHNFEKTPAAWTLQAAMKEGWPSPMARINPLTSQRYPQNTLE